LDLIRQRYGYACGYCGVTEVSAGGVLTVDHHRPLSAGGDEHLDNLVYACVRCNQYKHSFWPTDVEQAHGFRVLHPLQDLLTHHYRLNHQTGQLEPLTETVGSTSHFSI
jgi:5-methylcytosine-specific restriction endonuclease McrA